ncbi:MAG: helix-hairpin-helix domain-containing protein [Candidatus Omnitrophota bacterium]
MLAELQGLIERITYFNDETGYTVARVKVYGRHDLDTVVGTMHELNPGEIIQMKGEWSTHPKFGEQFKIVYYESKVPASVTGIQRYLGSGLIKGIGPVMAKRIVAKFGEKTLDMIERDANRLVEVEGIGKKRVEMISKAWEEQKEIRQVMIFLQSHGVSSAYATKIFRQYGNASISVVKENPYRLATDIFGIGFVTADRIAVKLGFAKDSDLRAQAGILYVLNQLSDEGHVYYPYELLMEESEKIWEIPTGIIENALHVITLERRVVIEKLSDGTKAVYLAKFHLAEISIASRIKALLAHKKSIRDIKADKALE